MIEEVVYAVLMRVQNTSGVDAVIMPQHAEFPRLRYQLISEEPIAEHKSGDRCAIPAYQVDVFGYDYKNVKEIAADVRTEMVNAPEFGASFISTTGDGYDPDTRLFSISQDFRVWSN